MGVVKEEEEEEEDEEANEGEDEGALRDFTTEGWRKAAGENAMTSKTVFWQKTRPSHVEVWPISWGASFRMFYISFRFF